MSAAAATIGTRRPGGAAPAPRAIVSNGINRFHLAVAAEEAAHADGLALLLTGGYPTARIARLVRGLRLDRLPAVARLLDRRVGIDEGAITPLWPSELLGQLGAVARSRRARRLAELLDDAALHAYARGARRAIRQASAGARIYHYRSGFGLRSVDDARRMGLVTLCDHSIVHPLSLDRLLGRPGAALPRPWRTVLDDLARADHVLVNSEFVRGTFLEHGWDGERVDVIYWGIDDAFLATVPPLRELERVRELRILFAGSFEARKGADAVVAALTSLADVPWKLELAGTIEPGCRDAHRSFLDDPRVSLLGTVPRTSLAEVMSKSDVFLFPTRAEGSARVVFEALACGTYVVTTPNAGSIVRDGIHGALVEPHDVEATAAALRDVWADRSRAHEIGARNAALVREQYRQSDYGTALRDLYARLGGRP